MGPARAFLVISVCLAACATAPDRPDANTLQPAPVALPQARVARLPAGVAIHYPQEFIDRPVVDRGVPGIAHRAGAASIALFDRVLEASFERVLRLPVWPLPAGAERPAAALVFVPRISGIATLQNPAFTGRLIEYYVEAYAAGGERVDAWTTYAKSRTDGAWNPRDDRLYPGALRDAAAQLLTSIVGRPALKARLPVAPATQGFPAKPDRVGAVRLAITSLLEPAESRERATSDGAACIAGALAQANPQATVVPLEQIQDDLFPWFEHSNLMDTAQQMRELMLLAPVREGLGAAGLDYVAFLHSERSSERNPQAPRCDTTYKAPGCSGVRGDPLKTRIQVTLWNLRRHTMSARFETESAGSATFTGVTVPLAGKQASSTSTCRGAADALSQLIGGR